MDKTSKLFILLVLAVICTCCQSGQNNNRKPVTKMLSGMRMKVNFLEGSKVLGTYENYLFLQESRDTSRVVVYKVAGDSLKRIKGLIDRGRGPYDFYYPGFSFYRDSLFVCNADPTGIKKIYGISLTEMSKIDDYDQWKEYAFPSPIMMTWDIFTSFGPGRFLVAGGENDARQIFSIADCVRGECAPVQYWPNDSTEYSNHSKQMVYMNCALCSRGDRVCYAHSEARYMFIGEVDNNSIKETKTIYSSLPKYEVKQDGNIRYGKDGEYGIRLCSTDDYIFAMLGRTVKEVRASELYKGYPNYYYDEIEVYDWEGSFVANFQTDKPFYGHAVTSDNHYLYVMTMDLETSEECVVRYELPL